MLYCAFAVWRGRYLIWRRKSESFCCDGPAITANGISVPRTGLVVTNYATGFGSILKDPPQCLEQSVWIAGTSLFDGKDIS